MAVSCSYRVNCSEMKNDVIDARLDLIPEKRLEAVNTKKNNYIHLAMNDHCATSCIKHTLHGAAVSKKKK